MAVLNEMTDIQKKHVSVREFTKEKVSEDVLREIALAARSASTSSFLQIVSVIRVTDGAVKAEIARLSGPQPHVAAAPECWIFCADFHRDALIVPEADLGWSEQTLIGVLDAGIMAQNAFAALESFGLGGVYLGGIRNHIAEIDALLKLPQNVFPVVGLIFGYPARKNRTKERLPLEILFHENAYHEPDNKLLADYDGKIRNYYRTRSANPKDTGWFDTVRSCLKKERRPFIRAFLQKKGFSLK